AACAAGEAQIAATFAEWACDPDLDGVPTASPVCIGNDACPNDRTKTSAGICGCGVPDVDSDADGAWNCQDQCPQDGRTKTTPCGAPFVNVAPTPTPMLGRAAGGGLALMLLLGGVFAMRRRRS